MCEHKLCAAAPMMRDALEAALEFFEDQIDADINAHIPWEDKDRPLDERRQIMLEHEGNLDAIADLEENLDRIRTALGAAREGPASAPTRHTGRG